MCYKVNLSPNETNEMGVDIKDKPYPEGHPNYFGVGPRIIRGAQILIMIPFALYQIFNYEQFENIEMCFIVAISLCAGLRLWSYGSLGRLFTFGLGIRDQHVLVKDGPYMYLTHPSYTGQLGVLFMMWFWMFVYTRFTVGYILFSFLFIFSLTKLVSRIHIEEKMMSEHFGNEYAEYQKTRYRLIPFVF